MDNVEFELLRREVGELKERISLVWFELEKEYRMRLKFEAENSFLKEELERNRLLQRSSEKQKSDPNDKNRLIDEKEASFMLNIKVSTLAVWRSTGRENLPFCKVGRMVRYRVSDIDEYLKSKTTDFRQK